MRDDRDDRDDALRGAFAALREEDARAAGSFASLVARPRTVAARAPLAPVLGAALAAAAVLAALAVSLVPRRGFQASAAPVSIASWTAPTDFLLRTPGIEVLGSVPRIAPPRSLLALEGAGAGLPSNRRSPSP
jgi:hypothetical protein